MKKEVSLDEVTEKVRENLQQYGTGPFKPCLYYDQPLDCIRAVTKDCSATEINVHESPLVILKENYSGENSNYVGFSIEGARGLCRQFNLPTSGRVPIRFIVESLAKDFKKKQNLRGLMALRRIIFPMIFEHDFQDIEFPSA